MTSNDVEIRHYTSDHAAELRETLMDVYREVYADSIADDPFNGVERFGRGLDGWSSRPGWTCTVAYDGDQVVGYAYGAPLPEGAAWWRGLLHPVPEHVVRETGTRTYAISELMVRVPWRKTGVSRRLHDELLAPRKEGRATLLVRSSHPKVHALYVSWGWRLLGQLIPRIESAPKFDAMLVKLPLRGETNRRPTGSKVLDRVVAEDDWAAVLHGDRLLEPSQPHHVVYFISAEEIELMSLSSIGMLPVPAVGEEIGVGDGMLTVVRVGTLYGRDEQSGRPTVFTSVTVDETPKPE
ncbi:GNAT family N-acetyltransferase [Streptomyces sp. NPDC048278]|uniref:GNAT family N-acetyltransferase n=1 Tax=Streptomyces sp. NPDC048278 TaxID=3155809 RepID=UPI003437D9B3